MKLEDITDKVKTKAEYKLISINGKLVKARILLAGETIMEDDYYMSSSGNWSIVPICGFMLKPGTDVLWARIES